MELKTIRLCILVIEWFIDVGIWKEFVTSYVKSMFYVYTRCPEKKLTIAYYLVRRHRWLFINNFFR